MDDLNLESALGPGDAGLALLMVAEGGGDGESRSSMLRTGGCVVGTGLSMSSMLRTGGCVVGAVRVLLGPSSSMSNMLRTGERGGAAKFDDECRLSGEEPLLCLFASRASTSWRSMSSIASMLMGRVSSDMMGQEW